MEQSSWEAGSHTADQEVNHQDSSLHYNQFS
jgi:hypothetical protein